MPLGRIKCKDSVRELQAAAVGPLISFALRSLYPKRLRFQQRANTLVCRNRVRYESDQILPSQNKN